MAGNKPLYCTVIPPNSIGSHASQEGRLIELRKLRAENPLPKLWKKFETPKFGAGRSVRFGDLNGDGAPDMLIAQNIPRVRGDAFDAISCLTAVNLDGKVLWLSGRYDNVVYAIDTGSGEVRIIPVGKEPHGLTVWPQPGRYSLGHTGNMR